MRLSLSTSVLLAVLCVGSEAFVVSPASLGRGRRGVVVSSTFVSSSSSSSSAAAEAAAALADGRDAAVAGGGPGGEPSDGPAPSEQFSADVLEDMRISLEILERRVRDGPGSLSVADVEELDARTRRVVDDMLENAEGLKTADGEARPVPAAAEPVSFAVSAPPPPASPPREAAAPVSFAVSSPPPPPPPPPPQPVSTLLENAQRVMKAAPPSTQSLLHAVQPKTPAPPPKNTAIDISNDDTPDYDGTGGMGLAKDTVNTYVIPGMEEMTSEEYRKALQKSVSDRQDARHRALGGKVGNRAANGYLEALGYGGASAGLS